MRTILTLVFVSIAAGAATAQQQNCLYRAIPEIVCDGRAHSEPITLPVSRRPLAITSAFYELHTGTTPILEIGGLFNVLLSRDGGPGAPSFNLVGGMNRHGAVRWTHDPPVMLTAGDRIAVSYVCQVPKSRLRDALNVVRRTLGWSEDKPGMMPDIQICWKED